MIHSLQIVEIRRANAQWLEGRDSPVTRLVAYDGVHGLVLPLCRPLCRLRDLAQLRVIGSLP
jgi:hypothetical protein